MFVDSDRATPAGRSARISSGSAFARTVLCQDALRALAAERGTYDLILCDPPYDFTAHDRLAPQLARILAPDGLIVLQTAAPVEPDLERPQRRTSRKYGSARLTLFELMITAICPGSYDPVTNGHVDVIARAAQIFDRVVVGVVGKPQHKTAAVPDRGAGRVSSARRSHTSRTSRSTSSRSSSSTSRGAGRRR